MILMIMPSLLIGQNYINGVVLQENGDPVSYALVKSGKSVVSTDKKGVFKIEINKKAAWLTAERIGFKQFKSAISDLINKNEIKITLKERPVIFGEIVIEDKPSHSIPQDDEIINQVKMISQPMDAGDLIRGVKGFGVTKRGAYAQEPVFRSFKQEQINILFDGFIQYNHSCPNRMDPAVTHVIPQEIKKVEIIKGPFSVRYGPSMGATLNYLTESAFQSKAGFSGSVESGYEFNGEGKIGRAALAYKATDYDVYVNASIKDYSNYKSGEDLEVPSSFNSKDYGIKLGVNPADNQRLLITWKQSFLRDAKYVGLPMDARSDDSNLEAISYKIKNLSPSILSLDFNAYGNQVDHIMDNDERMNFAAVEAESIVKADTYGGKVEINLVPRKKNMLFLGVDYRMILRDGYRDRFVKKNMKTGEDLPQAKLFTDKIWQDSRMSDLGLYAENKIYLNNYLTFGVGIRMDMVSAKIKDPAEDFAELYDLEDQNEINYNANLSMSYSIDNGTSFQFALGRGMRSATIDERYINHFAVGKDPYELVGNPNLKPEVNNQVELSFRKHAKALDFQFNLFYSYLSNLITAAVDTSIGRKYLPWKEPKFAKRFENVEKAYQTGLEIGASYKLTRHLGIEGQFAYTYTQNISWDEPISRVPPMEASLKVSYEREIWWLGFDSRFVAAQNRVAQSFGENETPAFNLLNFRAGVKPFKGLVLGMTVDNILDTDYVEFLNWSFNPLIGEGLVKEPGRNISVYAKYSF